MECMNRRSLLIAVGAIAMLVGAPTEARAGGWAVTSLDPLPVITPGEPAVIAFTILQHGKTPVTIDDVSIDVTDTSGEMVSFEAEPEEAEGRYIATILLPEPGDFTWIVNQGWFGPQALGALHIDAGETAGVASEGSTRWPTPVRFSLIAGSLAMFVYAAMGHFSHRRRTGIA
jgi:YtkA-like